LRSSDWFGINGAKALHNVWQAIRANTDKPNCLQKVPILMQKERRSPVMPNVEVSDGGPLTHESPAAQSRRSLH
jgi:hypothetical protein